MRSRNERRLVRSLLRLTRARSRPTGLTGSLARNTIRLQSRSTKFALRTLGRNDLCDKCRAATAFRHRNLLYEPIPCARRNRLLIRTQDTLEIEFDGSPQPEVAIVVFRDDLYGASHPTGAEAVLVLEVGDTERHPRDECANTCATGASALPGASIFRIAA